MSGLPEPVLELIAPGGASVVCGTGLPVLASHTELNQTNKSRFLRPGEAAGLAFSDRLKCAFQIEKGALKSI
jgi:hypothetical protein